MSKAIIIVAAAAFAIGCGGAPAPDGSTIPADPTVTGDDATGVEAVDAPGAPGADAVAPATGAGAAPQPSDTGSPVPGPDGDAAGPPPPPQPAATRPLRNAARVTGRPADSTAATAAGQTRTTTNNATAIAIN